ncbi:MAG: glycerol-3-phosphate dehydrogenase/oxidase [Myxococcota bacterium]
MPLRQRMWDALGESTDLLVIGGGITGSGIARDAVRRGLRTALVEMGDLASGTSSRSSKLVHGGLRYLEQYEFSLVFEAVSERRILMDIAPHLVNPLGFLFPVYKKSRRGLWMIEAGMWLYDGLSLFRSPKVHRTLKVPEVQREEPALQTQGLTGAPLYYDCATDDARLTLETALDAVNAGAVVVPYAKVVELLKGGDGRVVGAVVQDVVSGARKEVRAHAVINATGPWTDATVALGAGAGKELLRPTKGVHIVVPHDKLPVNHAVVALHPKDGRVLFAIPWGDRSYIGTTDTDYEGDPGEVAATRADVDYLIDAAAAYFPQHLLTHADVVSTWAGLRRSWRRTRAATVSRRRRCRASTRSSSALTARHHRWRQAHHLPRMAAEVVDTAVNPLRLGNALPSRLSAPRTEEEPLPGAVGWPDDDDHDRVASPDRRGVGRHARRAHGMAPRRHLRHARHRARAPGRRSAAGRSAVPGRPEIVGQVDWAVREELATRVLDVMVRRTQLYHRDLDQAHHAEVVAQRMASLLGWDEARLQEELGAYEREVARSRRWRQG